MSNANPVPSVDFFFMGRNQLYLRHEAGLAHARDPRNQSWKPIPTGCTVYTSRIYSFQEDATMSKARVFKSGNSQAVRLPKEFRFDVKEVEIFRRGDEVILRKPKRNLRRALALLQSLPDDFMADGRQDTPPQEREPL
jgi:antitoxin VapB